ncbi:hypothetical protein LINGRAHAP2_LOCUS34842 [Linum grandiflorum]
MGSSAIPCESELIPGGFESSNNPSIQLKNAIHSPRYLRLRSVLNAKKKSLKNMLNQSSKANYKAQIWEISEHHSHINKSKGVARGTAISSKDSKQQRAISDNRRSYERLTHWYLPDPSGSGGLQVLVGKMFSTRKFTATAMKPIMAGAWQEARGIRASEMGEHNTFVFSFKEKKDLEKVWKGRPWIVSDSLLNLKRWDGQGKPTNLELNVGDWWIQIHDLPMELRRMINLGPILRSSFPSLSDMDQTGLEINGNIPSIWLNSS